MYLNKKIHVLISAFTIALFSIKSVMAHDVNPPDKVKGDEKLEELLPLLERKYSAKIGVALKDLNGKKLFQYRENERFKMSSTVKVPLAAFLYYEHEKGRVEINELVDVRGYKDRPPLNERTIDWYNLQYIPLSKDLNHMIDMAHQFYADERGSVEMW